MLMPKRVKWRRQHRGRIRGEATRGNEVAFGEFGLQSLEPGWVSARVIEAGRIACGRNAPEGKVWIRIFPHKSVSKKPAETRQGSGQGRHRLTGRPSSSRAPSSTSSTASPKRSPRSAFNRVAHKLPGQGPPGRRRHN